MSIRLNSWTSLRASIWLSPNPRRSSEARITWRPAGVMISRANFRFFGVRVRTLSPLNLEKDVEFYEVRLARGGALRSTAHFTGTREFLAVESGRVRIESGEDSEELGRGDSVTYRADVNHAIVNLGDRDAVVFLVDIYR